ncbi:MAG: hypothetical protein WAT39_24435 [Planctomycetota bacterium]
MGPRSAELAAIAKPPLVSLPKLLLLLAAAWLIPYGPLVAWHCGPLLGLGGWSMRGSELFLLVPGAGGVAVFGLAPLSVPARTREWALPALLVSVVLVVGFLPAIAASDRLRMYGFDRAGERGASLVAAIERHVAETGFAPANLASLVPRWLPELPVRLPPLEIVVPGRYGNPWMLRASVPSGMINFDEFVYLPHQDYPEHDRGGSFQRLGRWAYYHE